MDDVVALRFGFFVGAFALIALVERAAPRRPPTTSKMRRWSINLLIIALNPLSVHLVFPVLPVGMALLAEQRQWGLLSHLGLPSWLDVVIGFVVLDLSIYLQHVLHHAVPALWRLHMVHHADLDYDMTTGLRFHPIEILISMGIKLMTVAVLGPPALAVLLFEVALNVGSMFNHSNIRLPIPVDRVLRLYFVTPDMHRVHHSVTIRETNSNFGFNLPWWDRLLGTYKDQPERGHDGMTIGLSQFRDPNGLTFPRLLILPFVGDPGGVPINRH